MTSHPPLHHHPLGNLLPRRDRMFLGAVSQPHKMGTTAVAYGL